MFIYLLESVISQVQVYWLRTFVYQFFIENEASRMKKNLIEKSNIDLW